MSPDQISRRTLLSTGGVLTSLGVVGASAVKYTSDDDQTPGADGFTAKSVPSGSDPLVLIDVDRMAQNDAAKAATRTLLDAGQFDDLPDSLVGAFENEPRSPFDAGRVGKVALVGSDAAADAGGAVVWADWTDNELLTVLESGAETDTRVESYSERTLYTTGKTSAAVLGDTEFALGTTQVVRDIVDVWHGDADPVGGDTLNSFERTPRQSHVRFAFEGLRLTCDEAVASPLDAYDHVTRIYGWVPSTCDGVRLRLRVDPSVAASEVASTVKADLGTSNGDGGASNGSGAELPHDVAETITVEHEHDFVAVEYSPASNENGDFVSDVIETTVCLAGRPD